MNPDSLSAFKLLHDVDAAATEARPMRMTFNPVVFLEALHKRGWVIVRQMDTEFEEVQPK